MTRVGHYKKRRFWCRFARHAVIQGSLSAAIWVPLAPVWDCPRKADRHGSFYSYGDSRGHERRVLASPAGGVIAWHHMGGDRYLLSRLLGGTASPPPCPHVVLAWHLLLALPHACRHMATRRGSHMLRTVMPTAAQ